jgi:SNF2 family DNA or RNA helicase
MFTGTLHPYQVSGVQRIVDDQRLLVAYSMGTGKTVLTIAAMEELFGQGRAHCCLILVPATVKFQWAKSIASFVDCPTRSLRLRGQEITVPSDDVCMIIDGPRDKRAKQWQVVQAGNCDYVIASYASVLADWRELTASPVDAMVLDEATAIKNFSAQTSKRVKRLLTPVRIALTGTPVENRPEDIYSIMEWVDAELLGRWDLFDKTFIVRNHWGAVVRYKNLDLLHRKLQPRMIRKSRRDPDVAPYLPTVAEHTHTVVLDAGTRRLYRLIQRDLLVALDDLAAAGGTVDLAAFYAGQDTGGEHTAQGRVMARLLAARMLLDHPGLLMDSAVDYLEGAGRGSQYAAELVAQHNGLADHQATPKLDELVRQVDAMMADDDTVKIAVYTDFRRMLPYLAERLDQFGKLVEYHGGLNATQKAAVKERFATDPDCRTFLSTNAGGVGLDLPEAQYLINVDLPHSGGILAQRNARHVRASSTHARVYVVNLVTEDSIEERQQATLALRARLAEEILDGRGTGIVVNSVGSLTEHLENDLTRE